MQHLGQYKHLQLSCIPKNKEKYISFSLGSARFLDSLNFMNEGLSKLVDNLVAEGDQHLHHIKHHFPDPNHRKLLLRKGVYPYEWMNSMEKMEHTSLPLQRMEHTSLPPKECFNSTLTMSEISDKELHTCPKCVGNFQHEKQWEITMISTSLQMCYYWLTALKTLGKPAYSFMDWIQLTTLLHSR